MRIDKRIINVRLTFMMALICISSFATYVTNINELIFVPMFVAFYYIPFRFKASLKVIYPRFIAILLGLLIGLVCYKLFLYYKINFNLLIMGLLVLSAIFYFITLWCGLALLNSIIIFSYCTLLNAPLVNAALLIFVAIILATIIVLLGEWLAFKIFNCNDYELINQDEVRTLIANSWEQFNQLSIKGQHLSTNEVYQILQKIEQYLVYLDDLRVNCIESFSNECAMINELDNYHNKLSSIYGALSRLVYDVLYKQDRLIDNTRYDDMEQKELFN